MRFHPGRAVITRGLAIYSWRAPGVQEAPFVTKLPLRHAPLGTVTYTVAWGVPFDRPRRQCPFKGTPPPPQVSENVLIRGKRIVPD